MRHLKRIYYSPTTECTQGWQGANQPTDANGENAILKCAPQSVRNSNLENIELGLKANFHPIHWSNANMPSRPSSIIASIDGAKDTDNAEASGLYLQQNGANPNWLFAVGNLNANEFLDVEFSVANGNGANAINIVLRDNTRIYKIIGNPRSIGNYGRVLIPWEVFNTVGMRIQISGSTLGTVSLNISARKIRIYTCNP